MNRSQGASLPVTWTPTNVTFLTAITKCVLLCGPCWVAWGRLVEWQEGSPVTAKGLTSPSVSRDWRKKKSPQVERFFPSYVIHKGETLDILKEWDGSWSVDRYSLSVFPFWLTHLCLILGPEQLSSGKGLELPGPPPGAGCPLISVAPICITLMLIQKSGCGIFSFDSCINRKKVKTGEWRYFHWRRYFHKTNSGRWKGPCLV